MILIRRARGSSRAFTLIELITVMTLLALVSTVVVMRVGNAEQEARLSVSLSNMADVTRAMDTFIVRNKNKFPDGFDSLLEEPSPGTTIYNGDGTTTNSGVYSAWLEARAITASERQSMRRMSMATGNDLYVYDHSGTATDPSLSTDAATARAVATNDMCVFVSKTASGGQSVFRAFSLDPASTTYSLLALGVGTRCTLVGNSLSGLGEAPFCPDVAPNWQTAYRRPVALFKVDTSGGLTFAEFVGVVTSYGKPQGTLRSFLK